MGTPIDAKTLREALAPIDAMRKDRGIPAVAPYSRPALQGWSPIGMDTDMAAQKRAEWRAMTPQQRAEVLAECEQRRREAEAALHRAETLERIEDLHAASGVPILYSDRGGKAKPWTPPPDDAEERVWNAIVEGRIVLLVGAPGRGKSRMLCRMVERFIDSAVRTAQYLSLSEFMRARQREFKSAPVLTDRMARCGLLAFDEIDKAAHTPNGMEWVQTELFEVFDKRHQDMKPLLLAGNKATVFEDAGFGERGRLMVERIQERGVVIDVSGWPWMRGAEAQP